MGSLSFPSEKQCCLLTARSVTDSLEFYFAFQFVAVVGGNEKMSISPVVLLLSSLEGRISVSL